MMEALVAFPKYEAYTDSCVRWLGIVPQSWELARLGTKFHERRTKVSDVDYPPLSVTKKGILPQLENAAKTRDGDNRRLVKAGDFVINSRSDRKGSSGVSERDGSVSLINIVLEPKGIHPKFSEHLLKSYAFIEEFYRVGHGIVADLWTTRCDEMRTIILAIPSYEEQTSIANFLDEKTAQIDEAIAIKEKQICLLKARNQIIIQKAVTQGLNPNAKMKGSGVEWIGQIPEHWSVLKLKYLFKEVNNRTETGEETLLSLRMDVGLVPHDEVSDKPISDSELIGYKRAIPGQMVMNRMRAAIGIFGIPKNSGLVSPDYSVFDSIRELHLDYFLLLFKTTLLGTQFRLNSRGLGTGSSGFMRLYSDSFGDIKIPYCSKEEQGAIYDFINSESVKISNSIELILCQIEKLKVYKSTLIDSAVTGKIKVA